MIEAQATAATFGHDMNWHDIDWAKANRVVRRLQARIVKAVQEGDWRRAKKLQRFLTGSFSGRACAVRRVIENKGKATPGVDGIIWKTPESKTRAVLSLEKRGYKPLPLRRVYIPKANGKQRPLGIPTMKDRAMQALHLLALEPIAETRSDPNSYGFRRGRGTKDAAEQLFINLGKKVSPQWILDADITGCFDNISHEWLMANISMDKDILRKWLKAGFVENQRLFSTDRGTPQGGIITPPTMLPTRVVPRRERALVNAKYHVDVILTNLNAFDQRADQLPTPSPVEVFQARGYFSAELLQPADDEL